MSERRDDDDQRQPQHQQLIGIDGFLALNFEHVAAAAHLTRMPEVMRCLGACYEFSCGVSCDYSAALHWYQCAAESGNALAAFHVGLLHGRGQGVPKDDATSFRWYKLAADAGAAVALFPVGIGYWNGVGVERDAQLAGRYISLAAEYDDADAHTFIAYHHLVSGTLSAPQAVQQLHEAFTFGSRLAAKFLGDCYENGHGAERDSARALRYHRLAAKWGVPGTDCSRDRLESSTSSSPPPRSRCSLCGAVATNRCGGCTSVEAPFYCSVAHQKQHWPVHKPHCARTRAAAAARNIVRR